MPARLIALDPTPNSSALTKGSSAKSRKAWDLLRPLRYRLPRSPLGKCFLTACVSRNPLMNLCSLLGGAGGVGSIAIQLAKQLTNLNIIATASRSETQDWCCRMGAHHVIDHGKPLANQVKGIVYGGAKYALALTRTEDHFEELVEAMAPQSAMALIENPARSLDITKLKPKSISLHWEFMFTRSRYQTPDMGEQGHLLNQVADLVDASRVQSTLQTNLGTINAANMRRAHALVERGRTIGKIVLCGFSSSPKP
jgi:NADPH:quinone reductase